MTEQKLGIDLVKKLVAVVVNTAEEIQSDLSDNKMSVAEIVGLLDNGVDFVKLYSQKNAIIAQLKDVDSTERKELFDYVKAEYQAPNDHAEKVVDMVIDIVEQGFEVYDQGVMNLVEKVKDLVALLKQKPAAN